MARALNYQSAKILLFFECTIFSYELELRVRTLDCQSDCAVSSAEVLVWDWQVSRNVQYWHVLFLGLKLG